jgi:hypothetical protein
MTPLIAAPPIAPAAAVVASAVPVMTRTAPRTIPITDSPRTHAFTVRICAGYGGFYSCLPSGKPLPPAGNVEPWLSPARVIRPLSVDNPTSASNRRGRADAIVKLWTSHPAVPASPGSAFRQRDQQVAGNIVGIVRCVDWRRSSVPRRFSANSANSNSTPTTSPTLSGSSTPREADRGVRKPAHRRWLDQARCIPRNRIVAAPEVRSDWILDCGVCGVKGQDIVGAAFGDELEVTVDSLRDGVFGWHGFARYTCTFSAVRRCLKARLRRRWRSKAPRAPLDRQWWPT